MKNITKDMLVAHPEVTGEEDLPPEFTRYRDEGCEHAEHCLDCPFTKCLLEEPGGRKHFFKAKRNNQILRLHSEGKTTVEIAARFGVSERTIQRVVKAFVEMKG